MPRVADRLRNLFPSLILRSPLHRLLSDRYAIIEFAGRRSGRLYTTPVAYLREGERVLISTDARWWRNLSGGAPVRLRLRGRTVEGTARVVTDPAEAAGIVRQLVEALPSYAWLADLAREDGRVSDAEIDRAVSDERVAIEITLTSSA